MAIFNGNWEIFFSENFNEYMIAIGKFFLNFFKDVKLIPPKLINAILKTDISKVLKLILCDLLCTSFSNLANAKYTIKFKNDNSLQYLYKKNVIYIYIGIFNRMKWLEKRLFS